MGLFMMALLILSGILAGICEYCKDIKKRYTSKAKGSKTYRDHNGQLRNSATGNVINTVDGREIDGVTGQVVFNPYKEKERKELEICRKLGWNLCRVFNTGFEETLNRGEYHHKIIYRPIDSYYDKSTTPYGKLNCNLGYQFWVNLETGIMEETELSKSINHTEVKKYHKKIDGNRNRKVKKFIEDHSRPYTKEELEKENAAILKHLENHNYNVRTRTGIDSLQKFAPNWCYDVYHEYENQDSYLQDNLIYKYEREARWSIQPKREEGYYD